MPNMREVEPLIEEATTADYDLVAEERAKRRYYFVATPLAVVLGLGIVFAGMAVLPDRYSIYTLVAGFVVMQVTEEFVMIPPGRRDRARPAARRAVHIAIGGFLAAWIFARLGVRLGP